jgi:hypothetical protein
VVIGYFVKNISKHAPISMRKGQQKTYQATQMSTPTTRTPAIIKVLQQENKANKHGYQATRSDKPPRPP